MRINILDEERNRQAAARYGSFSSLPVPDGEQLFCHELLRHLENSTCDWEREAAKLLRHMIDHDATVQDIAQHRGSTEAAVRNLLKKAKEKLRRISAIVLDDVTAPVGATDGKNGVGNQWKRPVKIGELPTGEKIGER